MKRIAVVFAVFLMLFTFSSCESEPSLDNMNVSVRIGKHVRGDAEDHGNWEHAQLSAEGDVYTVKADLDAMTAYESSAANQGEAKWLALLIDTGINDLTNVSFNSTKLGKDGANEYKDLQGTDGTPGRSSEIVLWIKADDSAYTAGKPVTIGADGYYEKTITIKVEDTDYAATSDALREAVKSASGSSVIVLTGDIELSAPVTIERGKDIVIDLNGKKVSAESGDAFVVSAGKLLLRGNGTVSAGNSAVTVMSNGEAVIDGGNYSGSMAIAVGTFNSSDKSVTSGRLTFNSGTVDSREFSIGVYGTSKVEINGGSFTSRDNAVIGTNGSSPLNSHRYSITVNGGTFNGNIKTLEFIACGIYMANTGDVVLNGGTFNINGGVGILVRSGSLTANSAEISITEKEGLTEGKVGDSLVQVTADSQIVVDDRAGYPGEAPKILANSTGYVVKNVDGGVYEPEG